jgi:23S rRNA pseudouridine1911/1915/1917 synthase|tara:strand:+ start:227 stop:1036 length:810 start_codon:yes stop_codon:yes gene_type:complete
MSSIKRESFNSKKSDASRKFVRKPKKPIVMSTASTLQVLYEDNHIIAVNKRSSDIIQGDGKGDKSLCEVVAEYVAKKYNKPGKAFIGTVHRLDRPVSGVILYAKTSKALSRLTTMFRHREVQKTYWAVVKPMINPPEGHIVNYLKKNSNLNKSYAHSKPGEERKEAELMYKVLGRSDHFTFVEINPKSGRHHQIRVTLASLGSPIKGDVKYGAKNPNDNASVHLHARRIDFVHPVKQEAVTIIAPPQDDPLWDEFIALDLQLNKKQINR